MGEQSIEEFTNEISDEALEAASGVDAMGGPTLSTYSNTGCKPAPCGCIAE